MCNVRSTLIGKSKWPMIGGNLSSFFYVENEDSEAFFFILHQSMKPNDGFPTISTHLTSSQDVPRIHTFGGKIIQAPLAQSLSSMDHPLVE